LVANVVTAQLRRVLAPVDDVEAHAAARIGALVAATAEFADDHRFAVPVVGAKGLDVARRIGGVTVGVGADVGEFAPIDHFPGARAVGDRTGESLPGLGDGALQ